MCLHHCLCRMCLPPIEPLTYIVPQASTRNHYFPTAKKQCLKCGNSMCVCRMAKRCVAGGNEHKAWVNWKHRYTSVGRAVLYFAKRWRQASLIFYTAYCALFKYFHAVGERARSNLLSLYNLLEKTKKKKTRSKGAKAFA